MLTLWYFETFEGSPLPRASTRFELAERNSREESSTSAAIGLCLLHQSPRQDKHCRGAASSETSREEMLRLPLGRNAPLVA